MLNQPRPDIPDNFVACMIDITEHCSEDLVARCGGAVYLSGFYNDAVNVHICSLTPTVFVEALGFVPERYPEEDPARNDLNEELLGLLGPDDDSYYERSEIERMRREHPDRFKVLGDAEGETDREKAEAVREDLQGNPCF